MKLPSFLQPRILAQVVRALLSRPYTTSFPDEAFQPVEGFRGRPKADVAAAVDAAWKVAKFAQTNWDTIAELDINPLIVREKGQGAVVADALIRMQTEETE